MRYNLILLGLAIALSGCHQRTVSPTAATTQALPQWWQNPPQDTASSWYALGEGRDVNTATQQALQSLAGKMHTELSGQLYQRLQETEQQLDTYVRQDITTTIKPVTLSHYQVEATAKTAQDKTAVLVRLDLPALMATWQRDYRTTAQRVDHNGSPSAFPSTLAWYVANQRSLAQAVAADQLNVRIASLAASKSSPRVLTQEVIQRLQAHPLTLGIEGNHPELTAQFTEAFRKEGLSVGQCNPCDATLRYTATVTHTEVFKQPIASLQVQSTLSTPKGIYSTLTWHDKAGSVVDPQQATANALILAKQRIAQDPWLATGVTP